MTSLPSVPRNEDDVYPRLAKKREAVTHFNLQKFGKNPYRERTSSRSNVVTNDVSVKCRFDKTSKTSEVLLSLRDNLEVCTRAVVVAVFAWVAGKARSYTLKLRTVRSL